MIGQGVKPGATLGTLSVPRQVAFSEGFENHLYCKMLVADLGTSFPISRVIQLAIVTHYEMG
jgi:hypothetical protein